MKVMIVDNSTSMKPHLDSLKKVVKLLAYMLKHTDPNGLDIHLTQSIGTKNSTNSTDLVQIVEQASYTGTTDMRGRLVAIFEHYQAGATTRKVLEKHKFKPNRSVDSIRPLSFYILTDGKWNSNNVDGAILTLVAGMKTNKLFKERVGIQFIRFGKDKAGIARMDYLDNGLGLKEQDM